MFNTIDNDIKLLEAKRDKEDQEYFASALGKKLRKAIKFANILKDTLKEIDHLEFTKSFDDTDRDFVINDVNRIKTFYETLPPNDEISKMIEDTYDTLYNVDLSNRQAYVKATESEFKLDLAVSHYYNSLHPDQPPRFMSIAAEMASHSHEQHEQEIKSLEQRNDPITQ